MKVNSFTNKLWRTAQPWQSKAHMERAISDPAGGRETREDQLTSVRKQGSASWITEVSDAL